MRAASPIARRSARGLFLGALFVLIVGCKNPAQPDLPFAVPKDPGTLIVRVFDDAGAAVPNVKACVTQPNEVGGVFGTCAWTDLNGTRTFDYIRAGQRPVDIQLPVGYSAGPGGLSQTADVLKDKTTTVTFTIVRAR